MPLERNKSDTHFLSMMTPDLTNKKDQAVNSANVFTLKGEAVRQDLRDDPTFQKLEPYSFGRCSSI